MRRTLSRRTRGLLLTGLAIAIGAGAIAQDDRTRIVDGLAVHLGVVPAEMLKGHPRSHPERTMHGRPSSAEDSFHIVAAVFDAADGRRRTDLVVKATVFPPAHHPSTEKPLERMEVAGAVSYGNFFAFSGFGTFRIAVELRVPGRDSPIAADFTYERLFK
jgi:hypothetical protein